jgi:hypothetical protein
MDSDFETFDILNNRFNASFGAPESGRVLQTEMPVPVLFYEYHERPDGSLEADISEIECSRFAAYEKAIPQAYGYNYVVCPITEDGTPKVVREVGGPNDIEQTRGRSLRETLNNFERYCKSWLESEEESPDD